MDQNKTKNNNELICKGIKEGIGIIARNMFESYKTVKERKKK